MLKSLGRKDDMILNPHLSVFNNLSYCKAFHSLLIVNNFIVAVLSIPVCKIP